MRKNLWIDVHILQTVPISSINRDEAGDPKTGTFGGVQRARITSQAWKYVMREWCRINGVFEKMNLDIGQRTKKVLEMIAEEIMAIDSTKNEKEAKELAKTALTCAGINCNGKNETDALLFVGIKQAHDAAQLAVDGYTDTKKDKEKYKEAFKGSPSVDIALFGRMLAGDENFMDVEAAAEVAHSVSTHAVRNEYDNFTGNDDRSDTKGAAHMGTKAFNSFTMYRYMSINANELANYFNNEQVAEIIAATVNAFINSMPEGGQHAFAHHGCIDALYIAVRDDNRYNFETAFENPVQMDNGGGFRNPSKRAFVSYANEMYEDIIDAPIESFASGRGMEELCPIAKPQVVVENLKNTVSNLLAKNGDE